METKNKILLGIGAFIVLFIVSAVITFFVVKNNEKSQEYAITDDCVYEEENKEVGNTDDEVEVNSTTEKVSPNAFLIIKKEYNECGHTTEDDVEIPSEMVNKTQEEIEQMYKDFKVESFSSNEVVLYKNVNGKCGEHYTVKDENGKVVVYNTNEKGEEVLYEETSISTEYLTENDVKNIKKGIEIYGKQNLNSFIEDFE
jgi:hypothetical protein